MHPCPRRQISKVVIQSGFSLFRVRSNFIQMLYFLVMALLSSAVSFSKFGRSVSRSTIVRAATTTPAGAPGTMEYRVFFQEGAKKISPWHDIPLKAGEYYNFVNEIPK